MYFLWFVYYILGLIVVILWIQRTNDPAIRMIMIAIFAFGTFITAYFLIKQYKIMKKELIQRS